MAIYIMKIGVWNSPKLCGIHSKSQFLMQKTFLSGAFETLLARAGSCLRMQA